jgi:hypothetical protein
LPRWKPAHSITRTESINDYKARLQEHREKFEARSNEASERQQAWREEYEKIKKEKRGKWKNRPKQYIYFYPSPLESALWGSFAALISFSVVLLGLCGATRVIRLLSLWIVGGFKDKKSKPVVDTCIEKPEVSSRKKGSTESDKES